MIEPIKFKKKMSLMEYNYEILVKYDFLIFLE